MHKVQNRWQDVPGLFAVTHLSWAPHPAHLPMGQNNNKLSPGTQVMTRAMASPRAQTALGTHKPATPRTWSIAMGLLECTELIHMGPFKLKTFRDSMIP